MLENTFSATNKVEFVFNTVSHTWTLDCWCKKIINPTWLPKNVVVTGLNRRAGIDGLSPPN